MGMIAGSPVQVHTNGSQAPSIEPILCDRQAELALLGSIAIEPDYSMKAAAKYKITAESFYFSDHRRMFALFFGAYEANQPVDTATVGFDAPDLLSVLLDAQTAAVSFLHADKYAKQVADLAERRRSLEVAQKIANAAYSGDLSAAASIIQIESAHLAAAVSDEEDSDPNPLAALPAKNLKLGWVDTYSQVMTRLTGSPAEFNRLCGLVTVAAAIQRKAVLRMSFGDIYPNVYAAIIARSSVYHKSSALSKPRALLRMAALDRLLLSELATSEGLLKQLAAQNSGLIIRDEIGTLFSSHNTRYLQTLKPDLTALYDCQPYSRVLSDEKKSAQVDAPYLSILGATTPARFYEGVTFTDWADGFLARWLFVLPEGEPDFDAMTGIFTEQHQQELAQLMVPLLSIDQQRSTDFVLQGNAHGLWDAWQRAAAKNAYLYGDDVVAAIVTRYAAYALKFAMILAAVNGQWGRISEETMLSAISLADSYKANVHKLLGEKSSYGMSGAKLQKVFQIIRRKGGEAEGVTRKVISAYTKMNAGDITMCLEKLLEHGAISEDKSRPRASRYVAMVENLPVKVWK